MNDKYMTKQQIKELLDNWFDGFSNETRFINPIDWEISFCIQLKKGNKTIHKTQQKINGD